MKKWSIFSQLIIFMLLGVLITVQIQSIQKQSNENSRQKDINRLKEALEIENKTSLILEEQAKSYEQKMEEIEEKLLVQTGADALKAELDNARFYAGLTDVQGSGVIIKLDDSKVRISEWINPSNTIIHDSDLIEIVNLLKCSGAQAISINDERITSISEIQCAGPTVSVNHIRYAVPFEIKVIGDADYLEASLKSPGNILDIMNIYGIQIDIKKESNIIINRYKHLYNESSNMVVVGG